MTKKLKTFSHALRSCEKEGKWFIFSGFARKNVPLLPLFASEASKKQLNIFFVMYLEK